MTLQWDQDPIELAPTLSYDTPAVSLHGNKSLGGGNSRSIFITVGWGGEGDAPLSSALMDELEDVWDAVTGLSYTVTSAVKTFEVGGNIEKA